MTSSANIEMNDVKAAFKKIFPFGNRVFYESYHDYPTSSAGLFRSHFKGIASYNNKLIFTHTNLAPLPPIVGSNGPGKIMIADKQTSGDQASISAIYDTNLYHQGWSHPCSAQACGSFMAMGIQDIADSSASEIHILDLSPLDTGAQPQNIATITFVNQSGGQSQPSAINGVAMTKEHGADGKYIVAGLQGQALTIYRSVNPYLTSNPADNIFNVVGDTIQNFPRSGAGIALITQTDGSIYIISLDTDNDEGDNNSIYLCQLTITDSTVSSSDVLDSKNMPVPGLSEAVRYATDGWVITAITPQDPICAGFLTAFASGGQNINILNTSFRWGKGLAITSADDIEIYATDRNDLTTSNFSWPVDTQKDFSLVTWGTVSSSIFLTTQGSDGIYKFDTTTNNTPGQIPTTGGLGFRSVLAIDNILYLTTQSSDGIYTFDTNTYQTPSQITSTAGYGFRDVKTLGNILYLTTQGSDGIYTFDPDNPSQSPSQIPSTSGYGFRSMIVIGNILYLTTQGSDGIYTFDTQNPSQSPSQIPSTAGYGFTDVIAIGTMLYLTTQGNDGIYTFDTQNPSQSPSQIPSTAGYGFRSILAMNNIFYLTTQSSDGIFTFDTQNTSQSPLQIPSTGGFGFQGIIFKVIG